MDAPVLSGKMVIAKSLNVDRRSIEIENFQRHIGLKNAEIADLDACFLSAMCETGNGSVGHRDQELIVVPSTQNRPRDFWIVGQSGLGRLGQGDRPEFKRKSERSGEARQILQEAVGLAERSRTRIPTPQLNRFISDVVAARQPPAGKRAANQRLKLLFMSQTAERPPRFSIQVNSHSLVTRDYAYYLENRLRERYRMDGIPLVIDFVERAERRGRGGRA